MAVPSAMIFGSHFFSLHTGFCGDTGWDIQSFMQDVGHFSRSSRKAWVVVVMMGRNILDGGCSSGCKRSSNDMTISSVEGYSSRNSTLRVTQGFNRRLKESNR